MPANISAMVFAPAAAGKQPRSIAIPRARSVLRAIKNRQHDRNEQSSALAQKSRNKCQAGEQIQPWEHDRNRIYQVAWQDAVVSDHLRKPRGDP